MAGVCAPTHTPVSVSGLSLYCSSSRPLPAKYTGKGAETGVLSTDEKWHLGLLSPSPPPPSFCNGFALKILFFFQLW